MKSRKEIIEDVGDSGWINQAQLNTLSAILEVLLDIRDLLNEKV